MLRVYDMLGYCLLFMPWKIEQLLPYWKDKFNKEINSAFLCLFWVCQCVVTLCRDLVWQSVAPRSSCCNGSDLGVQQLSYRSFTQSWWPMVPRDILGIRTLIIRTPVSLSLVLATVDGWRFRLSLVAYWKHKDFLSSSPEMPSSGTRAALAASITHLPTHETVSL